MNLASFEKPDISLPMYVFPLVLTTVLAAALPIMAMVFFLFYPRRPLVAGRIRIQGLLPSKRKQLARLVWEGARHELSQGSVGRLIASPAVTDHLARSLSNALSQELEGLVDSAPGLFKGVLREKLAPAVVQRMEEIVRRKLPGMAEDIRERLLADGNLDAAAPEAVERFLAEALEIEVWKMLGRILPFVLTAAAIFGVIVGLIQVAIVEWLINL